MGSWGSAESVRRKMTNWSMALTGVAWEYLAHTCGFTEQCKPVRYCLAQRSYAGTGALGLQDSK